jgi:hypothetical protein
MPFVFDWDESLNDALTPALIGTDAWALRCLRQTGGRIPLGCTLSVHGYRSFKRDGRLSDEFKQELRAGLQKLSAAAIERLHPHGPLYFGISFGEKKRTLEPNADDTFWFELEGFGLSTGALLRVGSTWQYHVIWHYFVRSYAHWFLGIDDAELKSPLRRPKSLEDEVGLAAMRLLTDRNLELVHARLGVEFPEDLESQVFGCIEGFYRQYSNPSGALFQTAINPRTRPVLNILPLGLSTDGWDAEAPRCLLLGCEYCPSSPRGATILHRCEQHAVLTAHCGYCGKSLG